MSRRFFISIIVILLCIPLFSSAVSENSPTDDFRIVSLAPNVTETIYRLGSLDSLVGRTDYCNWPEEAKKTVSIGTMTNPNTELIVALKPDLVIASSISSPDYFSKLEKTGIKTYRFFEEYNGIEGSYSFIRNIGMAIGKQNEAEKLIEENKQLIKSIKNKTSGIQTKKTTVVLISWGDFGDYAATGDSYINDMIEAAGGKNIAENLKLWSISKEMLIDEDPQVIILSTLPGKTKEETIDSFKNTEPYNRLRGRISAIDADLLQRHGVRTAEAVEEIAKLIYPELF